MRMGYLAAAAAAVACAGCATVVRGAKDEAKFESEPSGATVTVESISSDKLGPFDCKTPCELELKRKREWNAVFTLEGYKPAKGVLRPKVTGGGVASGVGNVIAGGIIGIGVDAGTGANLDLRPNPMKARLAPVDSTAESTIMSEEEIEAEEKARKSGKAPAAPVAPATPAAPAPLDPAPSSETAPIPPTQPAAEGAPAAGTPEVLTMDPVDSASETATPDTAEEAPPQN